MEPAQVVFVVLDAFPNDVISRELTPVLWDLAEHGARHPEGGLSDLTAATYPNHLSFVSGRSTAEHGVITNRVLDDDGWRMSSEPGPTVPTIFDACRAEARSSVAVVGDQYLVGVCGLEAADVHWPPGGVLPEDAPRNVGGYAADEAVIDAAGSQDLDADLVFAQIDSVDGARHVYGATSEEAIEQCRATDAALGALLEMVRPRWENTIVCVVSDHDQEDLSRLAPIDLRDQLPDGVTFENQGTAALVAGDVDADDLYKIGGVVGVAAVAPQRHVLWGHPGREFGREPGRAKGDHGSPRTRTQVAIVAGGHPGAAQIGSALTVDRPRPAWWVPQLCEALELTWRPGRSVGP